MKISLLERLKKRTKRAQLEMKRFEKRKKKEPTTQELVDEFLSDLPKKLLKISGYGVNNAEILHIGHTQEMNQFQKLVFEGCKNKLGLPVVVKELWTLPPGDPESMGYFICVRWEEQIFINNFKTLHYET